MAFLVEQFYSFPLDKLRPSTAHQGIVIFSSKSLYMMLKAQRIREACEEHK